MLAAKLHFHAFYLLDDSTTADYNTRIATLYATASSLITLTISLDSPPTNFLSACPFSCYQAFVCAAFCILRIATNAFFQPLVATSTDASTANNKESATGLLEVAVSALRKMSVANNDLPARLGDVIGFLCTLPDPAVIGGRTADDLRLRQTRNRLSMSVVYDCLWTWRRHFRAGDEAGGCGGGGGGGGGGGAGGGAGGAGCSATRPSTTTGQAVRCMALQVLFRRELTSTSHTANPART
jgi:transcriptional regulatory protein LEU3